MKYKVKVIVYNDSVDQVTTFSKNVEARFTGNKLVLYAGEDRKFYLLKSMDGKPCSFRVEMSTFVTDYWAVRHDLYDKVEVGKDETATLILPEVLVIADGFDLVDMNQYVEYLRAYQEPKV